MTAPSPGIVAVGDGEPPLRLAGRSTSRAVAAALRTEYRAIVDRGLLLQIDAPDLAMERHVPLRRPAARRVPRVGRARRRRHQRRARRASTRPGPAARLLGQLRGSAHPRRRRSTSSSRCSTRPTSARWSISMANARHAHEFTLLRAPPAARRHGARRRRDRHDEQLRRAPRGRRRSPRARRRGRSATRTGSSPAPTAASTPRPGIGDVAPSRGVGEAAGAAGRRGPRVGAPVLTRPRLTGRPTRRRGMGELDGRVAIVTGSSSGIGEAPPTGWPRSAPTWW